MRNSWIAAVGLAAFALAIATAEAAPTARDLQRSGLEGTWAAKCNAAPSAQNRFVTFAVTARGSITQSIRGSAGSADRPSELDSLSVLADGKVTYVTKDATDQTTVILVKEPTRYKVWSSVTGSGLFYADETTTVTEGKVTQTGQDTPWLTRCPRP